MIECLQNVSQRLQEKGVAFPTCLSVNNNFCHFCPLPSDDIILREKDMIKIEMACHLNGFIVSQVHTVAVTSSPRSGTITGRAANVICAVNTAAEIISDIVQPGTKVKDFHEIIQGVAHCFSCTVLSISDCRSLKQHGSKESLVSISTPDEAEFLKDRAYIIDIAFATELVELEPSDEQATVYRSMIDPEDELQDESSRPLFDEIKQNFPRMPFSVRSLENYSKQNILAFEERGLLQPYHILHIKSGFAAHVRFTFLARPKSSVRLTVAPQQVLKPMIPADVMPQIDKLWNKMCRGKTGKKQDKIKLSYCGWLPVGEESSGAKLHILDVSWSPKPKHWNTSEALACTGSFGTYVYRRPTSMMVDRNIDSGWQKEVIQETPGKFCMWSPCGQYLAVGLVRRVWSADLPEVYIFHFDSTSSKIMSRSVYVGDEGYCFSMNPLSWSHDSSYLLAPSCRTHHVPVMKIEKNRRFIHMARFSENDVKPDDLCSVFHPSFVLFIVASTMGRLKLFQYDPLKDVPHSNKADIWDENGKDWNDDYGITDMSFSKDGKLLACARLNGSVKVWEFTNGLQRHNTYLSPLFIVENAGLEGLCVKWMVKDMFLAVGNAKEVISIYGHQTADKVCGNEQNADLGAYFEGATRMDWHPKYPVLALGGHNGLLQFWYFDRHLSSAILETKERNVHVENMFYTNRSLPCGAAEAAMAEYNKNHASMIKLLEDVVAESQVKDKQLDKISVLGNRAISRIKSDDISLEELAEYLLEIVQLSTKVVKLGTGPMNM